MSSTGTSSGALVTTVVQRNHSTELRSFIDRHARAKTATSTIGFVETVRACDRIGEFPNLMSTLLRTHREVPLTGVVRDDAARLPGTLRALDAIHVASAALAGSDLIALVTYDQRMADVARSAGLPVAMPGHSS